MTRQKWGVSFWVLGAIVGWGLLYFNAPVGGDRKLPTPSSVTPTHTLPIPILSSKAHFSSEHCTRKSKTKLSCHLLDPVDIAVPLDFLYSLGQDKILPMGCHWNAQMCGNPEDKSRKRIRISVALCRTGCQFWGWEWFETIFHLLLACFLWQMWWYLHGRFYSGILVIIIIIQFYYPSILVWALISTMGNQCLQPFPAYHNVLGSEKHCILQTRTIKPGFLITYLFCLDLIDFEERIKFHLDLSSLQHTCSVALLVLFNC